MKAIYSFAVIAALCTTVACKNGTTDNTSSGNNTMDVSETSTPLNGGSTGPQQGGQQNSQSADSSLQKGAGVGNDSATDGKTGGGSTGNPDDYGKKR